MTSYVGITSRVTGLTLIVINGSRMLAPRGVGIIQHDHVCSCDLLFSDCFYALFADTTTGLHC